MTRARVRLGLVGVGRWGRVLLRAMSHHVDIEPVAVASSRADTEALLPHGCLRYPQWDAMFAQARLDGVIIATPPSTHAAILAAAIGRGLPAVVEKPVSTREDEVASLLALARARQALVMVDHVHLFHPAFRRLCRMVRSDRFGPVQRIDGVGVRFGPFDKEPDVLWDYGPHDLAMAITLLGQPPCGQQALRLERRRVEGGVGEMLRLDLAFPAGVAMTATIGNLAPERARLFAVRCRDATLIYDDGPGDKLWIEQDGQRRPLPLDEAPLPLDQMLSDFAQAIRHGAGDCEALALGLEVTRSLARCAETLAAPVDHPPGPA